MTHTPTNYPKGLKWNINPVNQPLYSVLTHSAAAYPNRVAIDFMGTELTYSQVLQQAQHLAAGLQAQGLKAGDRVALILPNCPSYVISFFGVLLAGGVVVNCNPLLTQAELEHQLADSGAKFAIAPNLKLILPKVALALLDTAKKLPLKSVFVVNFAAQLPQIAAFFLRTLGRAKLAKIPADPRFIQWENLLLNQTVNPQKIQPNTPAVLQYTGGTTGVAKAAVLTHQNLSTQAAQLQAWRGQTPPNGDVILGVLPLCHIFALSAIMLMGLGAGAKLVLLPRFQKRQFKQTLNRIQPTLLPGVPALFQTMLGLSGIQTGLQNLKFCIVGGAPLTPDLYQNFTQTTGAIMIEGYGLTECSPVITCNPPVSGKVGTVGLPLPGTSIQIRDLKRFRKVLKQGETGEIWVHGPQIMHSYWNNTKDTADCLRGKWLRTGDVGFIDEEGFLHLTDRVKDIIITNGYNVYPRQIEDALSNHPAVAEVIALGLPHAEKGEVPHAYLTLNPGFNTTEHDLKEYAKQHLNAMAQPDCIVIRQSLPKTLIGKPSRKDLRAELEQFTIER